MIDDQINAAIAETCGWNECRLVAKVVLSTLRDPVAYGIPPNGTYEIACPNYSTDLNAMHEAEERLGGNKRSFAMWLAQILDTTPTVDLDDQFLNIHATARQRAEAFLRTLGKWDQSGDATEMVREVQK